MMIDDWKTRGSSRQSREETFINLGHGLLIIREEILGCHMGPVLNWRISETVMLPRAFCSQRMINNEIGSKLRFLSYWKRKSSLFCSLRPLARALVDWQIFKTLHTFSEQKYWIAQNAKNAECKYRRGRELRSGLLSLNLCNWFALKYIQEHIYW